MGETSWAQRAVDNFFEPRECPTRIECDQIARSVSDALDVSDVELPGSMSYTVVCTGPQLAKQGLVVSFREPEAHFDQDMVKLAQEIHASLVPEVSLHGMVDRAVPSLAIYTMPCLPGVACLNALPCQVEMDEITEARHTCFIRHLAR